MRKHSRIATVALFVALWLFGSVTVAMASTPAPELLSPHPNQNITTAPVTVIGIGADNTLVEVWEDNDVVGSGFSEGDGLFQFPIETGGFGSHAIRARQLGPDLGWSPFSTPITFTTDIAPVAPTFTAPSAGAVLSARPVTVSGNADSNATVTIKEGATTRASGLVVTNRVWSTSSNLADGTHTLTATATDTKGRVSPGSSITFKIDTVAPAAPAITSPASNATVGSTSVTVSGTGEGNASVSVFEGTSLRGTTTAAANGSWSVTSTYGTGNRCVTARATDVAGNQSLPSTSRCFFVDTTPPQATIATADNTVFLPGPAVVNGSASDGRGVARIELSYAKTGGTPATRNASCTGCPGTSVSWSDDASALGPGVYTLTATAVDLAGNRSGPASIRIVIL